MALHSRLAGLGWLVYGAAVCRSMGPKRGCDEGCGCMWMWKRTGIPYLPGDVGLQGQRTTRTRTRNKDKHSQIYSGRRDKTRDKRQETTERQESRDHHSARPHAILPNNETESGYTVMTGLARGGWISMNDSESREHERTGAIAGATSTSSAPPGS